ncbi:hypothetical protein [uncultured Azohydromonas sp.]|uniref:hypothetical protein n=1 Tax=uncultured Azohydromonas sp. TaxID=487342 RepID=UPI0026243498|nr:hypothetical protein [uncultured Azohydromonas sp.]
MTPSDASTPPAPSAARAAGSALAGHRIEAVLHAGPVFTVYRAVDALGIERVALKEYCPQAQCRRDAEGAPCLRDPHDPAAHAAFEAGRAAFVEEMRRLARLRLPGVVRVRDLVESEGSLCALMPLLPGVPLNELPASQNDEALHALLLSLVEPLAQLHAAGQVHGALHARQLLWLPGRAPVLLGFGSAARVLGVYPEPDDRAPELRTPDPQPGPAVGPWTDVYALAAMVMRQLSGRPWDDAAADIGVAALLEKALGPARDAGKRQVLVKALQSSLDSTPTRRPHHAGELRAQLVAAGVSRSARPPGAAPSPSHPQSAPQPGEAERAASRLPEAMARSGPEPAMPALRPDGSCVIPQPPRRRDDSRRNALLVLALALGCVASGWWVRGLWSDEQERQRIDRLLVGAANPPAWATAADGGDSAGLPPLPPSPVAQGATELPAPGEPSPLEALAEARAPAVPETMPTGASVVPPEPLAVAREAPPAMVEAPAPVAATPVTAPAAAAFQVHEPAAEAQTPAPAPLSAALATAPQATPVVPPSVTAAADKPLRETAPSPAKAQPPSVPDTRAAAQPSSRPAVQVARAPRGAAAKANRLAKAPAKAAASRTASTAPRAACGTQVKYALLQCMKRQCSQPSQRNHPQCQRLLRDNVISS